MITLPYKIVKTANAEKCCQKVKMLETEIANATEFVKNIEQGNLDAELQGASTEETESQNSLAGSLISMRHQMKTIAEQERERNWVTEGLAQFVEILRSNNDNLAELSDKILSNLVRYINANQGYLFIINENSDNRTLDLASCYAYNKKKYINKQVALGEGLVGQCYFEKETIYMTEVPASYVKITSGVGESLPRNIILVPLKMNDEVYGVVEMASFYKIKKYQIEFLEKLAESIASTIANAKVAERTKKLLNEAQTMAEQLRSQEEEMRQNMEELSATQEEMQRKQTLLEEKERYMNQVLNAGTDIIYTIDKEYNIVTCNDALRNSATGKHYKVDIGTNAMKVLTFGNPEKEAQYISLFNRVFAGEVVQLTDHIINEVRDIYVSSTYSPIRNKAGEIEGVAVFIKDITDITLAKLEAEKLLEASRQQTEEMLAQQEELRQNMEELSATQEELERRAQEVEEIRKSEKERADSQIASQKKIMEQFMQKTKERENQLLAKIKELESVSQAA